MSLAPADGLLVDPKAEPAAAAAAEGSRPERGRSVCLFPRVLNPHLRGWEDYQMMMR